MKVVEKGHIYKLKWLDGEPKFWASEESADNLIFVNREEGTEHPGTQTQEVLRALIDRTMHCDNCLRWEGNDLIIHHLRMALALHEARAILRKTEKGLILPEQVTTGEDGHFTLSGAEIDPIAMTSDACTYHIRRED